MIEGTLLFPPSFVKRYIGVKKKRSCYYSSASRTLFYRKHQHSVKAKCLAGVTGGSAVAGCSNSFILHFGNGRYSIVLEVASGANRDTWLKTLAEPPGDSDIDSGIVVRTIGSIGSSIGSIGPSGLGTDSGGSSALPQPSNLCSKSASSSPVKCQCHDKGGEEANGAGGGGSDATRLCAACTARQLALLPMIKSFSSTVAMADEADQFLPQISELFVCDDLGMEKIHVYDEIEMLDADIDDAADPGPSPHAKAKAKAKAEGERGAPPGDIKLEMKSERQLLLDNTHGENQLENKLDKESEIGIGGEGGGASKSNSSSSSSTQQSMWECSLNSNSLTHNSRFGSRRYSSFSGSGSGSRNRSSTSLSKSQLSRSRSLSCSLLPGSAPGSAPGSEEPKQRSWNSSAIEARQRSQKHEEQIRDLFSKEFSKRRSYSGSGNSSRRFSMGGGPNSPAAAAAAAAAAAVTNQSLQLQQQKKLTFSPKKLRAAGTGVPAVGGGAGASR